MATAVAGEIVVSPISSSQPSDPRSDRQISQIAALRSPPGRSDHSWSDCLPSLISDPSEARYRSLCFLDQILLRWSLIRSLMSLLILDQLSLILDVLADPRSNLRHSSLIPDQISLIPDQILDCLVSLLLDRAWISDRCSFFLIVAPSLRCMVIEPLPHKVSEAKLCETWSI